MMHKPTWTVSFTVLSLPSAISVLPRDHANRTADYVVVQIDCPLPSPPKVVFC